jgi:hypothetical protein
VNGDGKLDAVIVADDIPALTTNNKATAITVLQLFPDHKEVMGNMFSTADSSRSIERSGGIWTATAVQR